jgi:adenine phosphoribosyltransferase
MPLNKQVRKYIGQRTHKVTISGLVRELPLVRVDRGIYIVSDAELILGDVEFITSTARTLARKLKTKNVDLFLTAEAKSIALAYELARLLGHDKFVVARKSVKAYMESFVAQKLKSITTASEQQLLLTKEDLQSLSGRRVCLLDDVVSTGATFSALERITEEAGGKVVCRAAIWREGPWYSKRNLVYIADLPVFVPEGSALLDRT